MPTSGRGADPGGRKGERRVKKREKRRNLSLGTKIRPWIFWEPQGRVLVSKVHQV